MSDWLSDIMVVVLVGTVWIGLQRSWNSAIQSSDDGVGEEDADVGGDIQEGEDDDGQDGEAIFSALFTDNFFLQNLGLLILTLGILIANLKLLILKPSSV